MLRGGERAWPQVGAFFWWHFSWPRGLEFSGTLLGLRDRNTCQGWLTKRCSGRAASRSPLIAHVVRREITHGAVPGKVQTIRSARWNHRHRVGDRWHRELCDLCGEEGCGGTRIGLLHERQRSEDYLHIDDSALRDSADRPVRSVGMVPMH